MNDLQITTDTTATIADYDGTTSLDKAIAGLGLCAVKSIRTLTPLKATAIKALALNITSDRITGNAPKIAIFEWLAAKVALGLNANDIIKGKTTPDTAPDTLSMFDSIPAPEFDINGNDMTALRLATAASDALATESPAPQSILDSFDVDDKTADLFEFEKSTESPAPELPATPADLFAAAMTTDTPSNVARLTESFTNEMALAPIQIRNVSYLNHSMQVVINDDTILDIKATHALALKFHDISAMHGQRVGELLLQVKAELNHGEFLPWLEKYVGVSTRQANRYMRGAKGLPPPLRTTNQNRHTVSYLNPPADLVEKVESLETETLRLENDRLQNDLIAANQREEKSAAAARFQKVQTDAAIERAVNSEVAKRLIDLDNEIRGKQQDVLNLTATTSKLINTQKSLTKEVGLIQVHNELIASADNELRDFAISIAQATDTAAIPSECYDKWLKISQSLSRLNHVVAEFVAENKPIEGTALTIIDADSTD